MGVQTLTKPSRIVIAFGLALTIMTGGAVRAQSESVLNLRPVMERGAQGESVQVDLSVLDSLNQSRSLPALLMPGTRTPVSAPLPQRNLLMPPPQATQQARSQSIVLRAPGSGSDVPQFLTLREPASRGLAPLTPTLRTVAVAAPSQPTPAAPVTPVLREPAETTSVPPLAQPVPPPRPVAAKPTPLEPPPPAKTVPVRTPSVPVRDATMPVPLARSTPMPPPKTKAPPPAPEPALEAAQETVAPTRLAALQPAPEPSPMPRDQAPPADDTVVMPIPVASLIFEGEEDGLSDRARGQIAAMIPALEDNHLSKVVVKSYASGRSANVARRLALKRALTVRTMLVDRGISRLRIDLEPKGMAEDGGALDRVDVFLEETP